jgi:hypothetical protein
MQFPAFQQQQWISGTGSQSTELGIEDQEAFGDRHPGGPCFGGPAEGEEYDSNPEVDPFCERSEVLTAVT